MATDRISTGIELGRKYDIDYLNWTESVEGTAQFTFGNLSFKSTGLIKVANRFLKILLTRSGSDPFNPDMGTYLEDIQYMGGSTKDVLYSFISTQLSSALSQVQEIQAANSFPDDENVVGAVLKSIDIPNDTSISIYISIQTESGEEASVQVPIIGG